MADLCRVEPQTTGHKSAWPCVGCRGSFWLIKTCNLQDYKNTARRGFKGMASAQQVAHSATPLRNKSRRMQVIVVGCACLNMCPHLPNHLIQPSAPAVSGHERMSRAACRSLHGAGAALRACLLGDAAQAGPQLQHSMQQQFAASTSSSGGTDDWTSRVNEQFAVQPSYFSPLYSTYKQQADKGMRRQLAAKLLMAHSNLANEVEGLDAAQINAATRHRIREMQRLADELRALNLSSNLPTCNDRKLALGFYSLLEEESMGRDADAEAFHATIHGQGGNVWEHWQKHFVAPYARAPGLEPLHVVYSRQDAVAQASTGEEAGSSAERLHNNPPMSVSISTEGVARATGKRKSSIAQVSVAPGKGRVIINNQPHDHAFQDPGLRLHVLRPFFVTGTMGKYDVVAQVHGSGLAAMAQAVQHGIAQALTALVGSRAALKGMVQRDIRRVERKKPGRMKARKGFAYVRR